MASRKQQGMPASATQPSADAKQTEQALILYNELLMSRNRLAALPPVTRQDLEVVRHALHEVVWFFMTPPKRAKTALPLREEVKAELRCAAESRPIDLYVETVALIALKLGRRQESSRSLASDTDALTDLLDTLTFDHRRPKRAIMETLRRLKNNIDARIAYVQNARSKGFTFPHPVESYAERKDKTEKPNQFFGRVYAKYVPLGLTQADIRRADPAFYNVFHVWCSRNHRRPESFVPALRPRRD
ncbi:hypothetical protein [Rhodovulum sp. PH10]|uniref:hypothetical protein n=1 Tax=Rhodovulum sp. PH10 TaxID=1187851 RepID=UPI0012F93DBB|nr:hypothetical protein [Rhodovulum sp. PH10]